MSRKSRTYIDVYGSPWYESHDTYSLSIPTIFTAYISSFGVPIESATTLSPMLPIIYQLYISALYLQHIFPISSWTYKCHFVLIFSYRSISLTLYTHTDTVTHSNHLSLGTHTHSTRTQRQCIHSLNTSLIPCPHHMHTSYIDTQRDHITWAHSHSQYIYIYILNIRDKKLKYIEEKMK